MIIITRAITALIAVVVAAMVFAGTAVSDEHDRTIEGKRYTTSGEREISPFEFIVNIAQKTNLSLVDAKRFIRDKELFHQQAFLHDLGDRRVGRITVQRSTLYGFKVDRRSPSKTDKSMKRFVENTFANVDPQVERIEKFKNRNGFGRIAFVRVEDTMCLVGAATYFFENLDFGAGRRVADTVVQISYCDPFGRTDQIIEFLKDVKLVTPADNRAAYALRESGKRSPTTVTSSESDEEIEARVSQVRALQKKGLISEEEAERKINKIRTE